MVGCIDYRYIIYDITLPLNPLTHSLCDVIADTATIFTQTIHVILEYRIKKVCDEFMMSMKLVWIFAFLPFCFGVHEVTNGDCMNVANTYSITFAQLVNGKACVRRSKVLNGCVWYRHNFGCVLGGSE